MAINQAGQSAEGWLICNYAQQKVANSDATRLDKLTATNCQMKAPPIVVTSSTGQITTYSYNADGQLISTTSFSWNSVFSIPGAIAVNGYSYVYAGGLPVEHIAPNGSVLSYLANREGSTVALTDSTGKVVAHYAYSAYGSLICGRTTPSGVSASGTLSPATSPPISSPPCHPSPPTPPAACPPPSQHSPVGPPPCIARAYEATLAPVCSGWWIFQSCSYAWSGMNQKNTIAYIASQIKQATYIEWSSLWGGSYQKYLKRTGLGDWTGNGVSISNIPYYEVSDQTIEWLLYQLQIVDVVSGAGIWLGIGSFISDYGETGAALVDLFDSWGL